MSRQSSHGPLTPSSQYPHGPLYPPAATGSGQPHEFGQDHTVNTNIPYTSGTPVWNPSSTDALCNCGPECGCLGCPVHYYNDATTQHFASLQSILEQDSQDSQSMAYGGQNPPLVSPVDVNGMSQSLYAAFPNGVQSPTYPPPGAGGGPAPALPMQQYPSAASMPMAPSRPRTSSMDMPFSHFNSSDYVTVEFPLQEYPSCADRNGNCMCDDDCQCMGCMIHKPNGQRSSQGEPLKES